MCSEGFQDRYINSNTDFVFKRLRYLGVAELYFASSATVVRFFFYLLFASHLAVALSGLPVSVRGSWGIGIILLGRQ